MGSPRPFLPVPPPIRTDGTNPFARYSMEVRVPEIARDTLARNREHLTDAVSRSVEHLARSIEQGAPIPAPRPPSPGYASWQRAYEVRAGERWLAAEWFYAELAFYRELLDAFRYWETGRDPFDPFKEEEIAGARLWQRLDRVLELPRASRAERLAGLLDACLWGNRVDLSYTVAASRDHVQDADLLADDRAQAVPLLSADGAHVHVVLDNAGTELCLDLVLVDAILEAPRTRVTLHLKIEPTFVSDATPRDLWRFLGALGARGGEPARLASRLRAAFDEERLRMVPDAFWSGPDFMSAAPLHVSGALAGATLALFKGDANYRRVVGDAVWPADTPFAEACKDLGYPLLCLRTMKSDAVLGLRPGLAEQLDNEDPRWRVDGRRGVAQAFVPQGAVGAGAHQGA